MSLSAESLDQTPLLADFRPEAALVYRDDGEIISQQQFLNTVLALAEALPDVPAFINFAEDRYLFLLSFCAVLVKGSVNILPPGTNEQVLRQIKADHPDALLMGEVAAADIDLQVLVKRLPKTSTARSMAVPNIRLQTIAAIAYTSGSTGKPKANSKTWAVLSGTAQLLGQRFLTGEQLLIPTVPPQHMYGLETSIFMTLQTPAALFAGKTFYPKDIAQAASDHANSILVTTPVHLRALDQALPALKGVGKVISATAALQQSLAQAIEAKLDCSVEEIYGFTEAGSTASRRTLDGAKWQLLDSMQLIAEGSEIFVTGPQLSERVAVLDKISLLANGSAFELAGRAEDIINVAGKRASLVDLNNKLLAVDGVEDAIIFMPEGEAEAKRPAALIVTERDKKAVLSDFAKKVEAVFIPRPVYLVPELKRQATGKIPRQQLLATLARLRQKQRAAE